MKKILVGVDLKAKYVWLVVRGGDLAKCIDGSVDLLYVSHDESATEQEARQKSLEGLLEHLEPERRGKAMVTGGDPADVLKQQSTKYDVLVCGPREPIGWRKLVEDAMAVRVIGGAKCPVFIPRREEPKLSFDRILLGLDLRREDPDSRVKTAGELAKVLGARLDMVFCEMNPARRLNDGSSRAAVEALWRKGRSADELMLKQLLNQFVPSANRGETFLCEDRPGSGLVELSKDYDLVIVGTADIVNAGILIGSVAVDVVRHADCDVLTLPA